MASKAETDNQNKPAVEAGAESPTTARPLEMDDDDVQETSIVGEDGNAAAGVKSPSPKPPRPVQVENEPEEGTEAAPAKPPRPLTEAQKNEMILKEAFPSVDQGVIKAVLRASGGEAEPAFNALLEMTDPEAVKNEPEDAPPARPPRPQGHTPMSQLEADELYARQLAEHYDNVGSYEARTSSLNRDNRQRGQGPEDDREHSFIDDDLPIIRDNLRKGFKDTQTTVNGWIAGLRKKLEESFDETEETTQRQGEPFRRQGEGSRRSGDYDRYDADPQVLSDDFAGMRFSSEGAHGRQHPLSNPNLHRPPPPSKSPRQDGRRVGFKEGHEEINMYDSSPKVPPKDNPPAAAKASKWQPLSSMEPEPITDNDPFSLGDSDDEKEAKEKPKDAKDAQDTKDAKDSTGSKDTTENKDLKEDESERLKKAAAEAMSDSLVDSKEDESAKKS